MNAIHINELQAEYSTEMASQRGDTPNTDYLAETREALEMLEGPKVPLSNVPAIRGYAVIEIETLDELRRLFTPGAYVVISNVRGFWLHVPAGGE